MAVLLGLAVAITYGASDFLGGFASKRSTSDSVVAMTQSIGFVISLGLVFLVGWDQVTGRDIGLSMGSGAGQVLGVVLLYRGLASGRMGVVAPVSAVTSAMLPIGYGLATGEDPSALALFGVLLAIIAVAIVASEPDHKSTGNSRGALALAIGAGLGFGTSFIFFGETEEASGFWPVVIARLTAVTLVVTFILVARRPRLPDRSERPIAVATGVLDTTANGLLLYAVRGEMLSLVAPVASLYPASTVMLARFVLHEPIGRQRMAGLALAAVALMFIAI
jgi:drug/metabolite transporter (DMT)-like permease